MIKRLEDIKGVKYILIYTMTNKQLLAKLAINKSLLKEYSNNEYSRIVYMDNNSEFQIQIFNPYTYTIGAVISIDNKSLGNT